MTAARRIGLLTALQEQSRLRNQVCCSEPWVEAVVPASGDGLTWQFLDNVYPPGGDSTLMRVCPACQRICPPIIPEGSPCCDCVVETAEKEWTARRKRLADAGMRRALKTLAVQGLHGQVPAGDLLSDVERRWWRRPMSILALFPKRSKGRRREEEEEEEEGEETAPLDTFAKCLARAQEQNAIYADDEPLSKGGASGIDLAMQITFRNMDQAKKESGRASGCQILLLSETEKVLQEEIAYYRQHGRIEPSAKRTGHPFRPDERENLPPDPPRLSVRAPA